MTESPAAAEQYATKTIFFIVCLLSCRYNCLRPISHTSDISALVGQLSGSRFVACSYVVPVDWAAYSSVFAAPVTHAEREIDVQTTSDGQRVTVFGHLPHS